MDKNKPNLQKYIIAVIIPAFCAEKLLEKVVLGIPKYIHYIIIVDDCSKDNTYQLAEQLAHADERIHVIKHKINTGVGGAMISGYDLAVSLGADIMIKMDSDDQMDPNCLPILLLNMINGGADYVKGNRFFHYQQLSVMPFARQIGNIGLSFLTKLASGYWNVFDPTNGYTAIWSTVYADLYKEEIAKDYFFETSMLIELGLMQAVIKDVYIPARYGDEKSALSKLNTILNFPPKLFKSFIKRIIVEYFIRDFSAVSLLLITGSICLMFGVIVGIDFVIKSAASGVPTITGTVMVSVLPIIIGFQFLLQALLLDIQGVPKDPIHLIKKV